MRRAVELRGPGPRVGLWLPLCLVLALAGSARATPVDVFFDGPGSAGEPGKAFGLSEAQATTAHDVYGVPFVSDWQVFGSVEGRYEISQSLETYSDDPGTGDINRARSDWDVTNVSGEDLDGASYLVFTHADPYSVDDGDVVYADADVGMTIDVDLGWVILLASEGGNDYFYPAILLDRSVSDPLDGALDAGATSDPFPVDYVVKGTFVELPPSSNTFYLPDLEVARAFTPVPEPGAGALLAAGLGLLALGRRRRA